MTRNQIHNRGSSATTKTSCWKANLKQRAQSEYYLTTNVQTAVTRNRVKVSFYLNQTTEKKTLIINSKSSRNHSSRNKSKTSYQEYLKYPGPQFTSKSGVNYWTTSKRYWKSLSRNHKDVHAGSQRKSKTSKIQKHKLSTEIEEVMEKKQNSLAMKQFKKHRVQFSASIFPQSYSNEQNPMDQGKSVPESSKGANLKSTQMSLANNDLFNSKDTDFLKYIENLNSENTQSNVI